MFSIKKVIYEIQSSTKILHITEISDIYKYDFNSADNNIVNIYENILILPNNNFETGLRLIYNNNGGTSIGGLTHNNLYYIYKLNNNFIKLSTEPVLDGNNRIIDYSSINFIDFTDLGVGTHQFKNGDYNI